MKLNRAVEKQKSRNKNWEKETTDRVLACWISASSSLIESLNERRRTEAPPLTCIISNPNNFSADISIDDRHSKFHKNRNQSRNAQE